MTPVWSEPLLFLNPAEAETVDALAARIVPGDADDPGAREAGAVHYVDRALAGFLRGLQGLYQDGLRELDAHCRDRHGARFAELEAAVQDDVCAELDGRAQADGEDSLGHLFAVVREHVVEGLFCDPAYGGNRDGVGWRMVGFPGAQWAYTPEQMARDFDATTMSLVTLADLHAGRRGPA
jgi:gluconate 2-dehydrogenase gamma chain